MRALPIVLRATMSSAAAAACVLASTTVLYGCQATPPPVGDRGGRMSPYNTTRQDRISTDANAPDLFSFGDTVAESLALEISQIPEIHESPTRVVIEFGTINNRTRTPTGDFELIQRRLRNTLQRSRHLRKYAIFVESRQRMERETRNVMGHVPGQEGPAQYDPSITYVLQGDFHEIRRGESRRYYFDFQLTNLASRVTVFSESFEEGYR